MCGIAGGVFFKNSINKNLVIQMNNELKHRGPDDEGFSLFNMKTKQFEIRRGKDTIYTLQDVYKSIDEENKINANLFLAHRRLSILDLSEKGHQPMSNEDSTVWITFNGEIYNYIELKDELMKCGHKFKSNSDTEVIIHSYEEWGFDCLNKFNGMWAFAIYDMNKGILFLSRDRFGVKPLYYYKDNEKIIFASEIKAILKDKTYAKRENEKILNDFLYSGMLEHSAETFFKDIYQIEPGHYGVIKDEHINIYKYYDINVENKEYLFDNAKEKFFDIFKEAVSIRLRSDVEIGTLLSGGIDSSSIVSMVRYILKDKTINTFSSVFSDKKYDEQEFIDEVNVKKNCVEHKVETRPSNLQEDIKNLVYTQEEPFGSLSIYAQWNVMRLVSESGIKVLLDGQGADEILAGYDPYYVPYFIYLFKKRKFKKLLNEKKIYFNQYNKLNNKKQVYFRFLYGVLPNFLKNLARVCVGKSKKNYDTKFKDALKDSLYDSVNYSLRQLLHYEDRNSMAFSIESRVPFLDYRLVEFLFSTSSEYKINNGVTKFIMREALENILPKKIKERKDKMGFVTPQEVWQKNELKSFFEDILESEKYKNRNYYKKLDLDRDSYWEVWKYVNIEIWMRMFIDDN